MCRESRHRQERTDETVSKQLDVTRTVSLGVGHQPGAGRRALLLSFHAHDAQANPCCVARIDNLILANPNAPGGRIYDAGISVQALVGNTPCTASARVARRPIPCARPSPAAVARLHRHRLFRHPALSRRRPRFRFQPGPNPRTDSGTGQGPVTSGHVPAAAGPAVVLPGEVAAGPWADTPSWRPKARPSRGGLPHQRVAASVTPRRTATAQRTPNRRNSDASGDAASTGSPETPATVRIGHAIGPDANDPTDGQAIARRRRRRRRAVSDVSRV